MINQLNSNFYNELNNFMLPLRAKGFTKDEIERINPDLVIVAAYGKILPKAILDIPKYGAINIHASLLPKYRGAAPIAWAIVRGERRTGITMMKMDEGMDTGPMLEQLPVDIIETETAGELTKRLADLGALGVRRVLPRWVRGEYANP